MKSSKKFEWAYGHVNLEYSIKSFELNLERWVWKNVRLGEFGGGLDMVYVGEDGELEEHGTDRNGY